MARSIVVGVVGDSGAGKTTVTRGLVRVLGDDRVTHVSADDYHRFDRRQRAEVGIEDAFPPARHVDPRQHHALLPSSLGRMPASVALSTHPYALGRNEWLMTFFSDLSGRMSVTPSVVSQAIQFPSGDHGHGECPMFSSTTCGSAVSPTRAFINFHMAASVYSLNVIQSPLGDHLG